MKKYLPLILLALVSNAFAETPIEVIPNKGAPMDESAVIAKVKASMSVDQYQSIKAQVVSITPGVVDSILVYLRDQNQVTSTSIQIDHRKSLRAIGKWFVPQSRSNEAELAQTTSVICPDESVQFIAMSQRKLPRDQNAVNEVADAAEKAGLVTVKLLNEKATRQNYLNYLSCPNLIGDFYDGDSNPTLVEAVDAPVSAQDFSIVLKGAFRNHVTHIWVACQAFNDPMLSAMVKDAQAQKFIAGKVDLVGGYSDRTGVCTMEAAIAGQSISKSFEECRLKQDLKFHDRWGIGGTGSDYLGQ
jgi:hypothetical protein